MEFHFVSETQHLQRTLEIKCTPPNQCYIKCIYTFCNNNLCNYIGHMIYLRKYNFYSIVMQYWYCAIMHQKPAYSL